MKDLKENTGRSFVEKESTAEVKMGDSLSEGTKVDCRDEENRKKIPHPLHLNMEITKEEFEILYTRL